MARDAISSAISYTYLREQGRGSHPIDPMPECTASLDNLIAEIDEVVSLGIGAVLLFGIPASKDPEGTEAYEPSGIVQEAIRVIKQTAPHMLVITDVCLDEFTDHGHCGIIKDGRVDNDATLELLARMAVCQASGRGRCRSIGDDGRAGGIYTNGAG